MRFVSKWVDGRLVALSAALGALWGCAGSQQEPQAPTSPKAAITLASEMCAAVQANEQLPVSCETRFVGKVPSIIVGFRNVTEAQELIGPFARDIGMPFCEAANRMGREGRIYMMVGTGAERLGRRWNCELGMWGEWARVDAAPQPEGRLDQAIEACKHAQTDESLPFGCRTEENEGVQSMFVSFKSDPDARQYFEGVVNQIAAPFCETANRAHVEAAVFITVAETRARRFDCKSGEWGEWFEVAKQRTMLPPEPARAGTPA